MSYKSFVKLYMKSTCTSCRDAKAALKAAGITADIVDYARKPLPAADVEAIVAAAGSVAAVLNTRHETAKTNGWATKPPAPKAFAKAVEAEVNLLRRPILLDGKTIVIGFDKARYADLAKR